MAPRIFILGISGYIGGQLLLELARKHPEYQITGMVRNEDQAQKIKARSPSTETVIGDLGSHEILYQEAQKADVIVQAADCDNIDCTEPLISGMAKGNNLGAFIQISGAASIFDSSNGIGQASTRIYDDIADLDEISTFDSTHAHAVADQTVQKLGKQHDVRTALVIPPSVTGAGEGPIKTKSMQLPWLQDAIATRGRAFVVGEGKATFSSIDVKDLASGIISLLEESLKPNGGKATWGDSGIYYLEAEEYIMIDITTAMAKAMHEKGIIRTAEIEHITPDEAQAIHPFGSLAWGANMRCKGSRIRRTLDWKPTQPSVYDLAKDLKQ